MLLPPEPEFRRGDRVEVSCEPHYRVASYGWPSRRGSVLSVVFDMRYGGVWVIFVIEDDGSPPYKTYPHAVRLLGAIERIADLDGV